MAVEASMFSCTKLTKNCDITDDANLDNFFWIFESDTPCDSVQSMCKKIGPELKKRFGSIPEHLVHIGDESVKIISPAEPAVKKSRNFRKSTKHALDGDKGLPNDSQQRGDVARSDPNNLWSSPSTILQHLQQLQQLQQLHQFQQLKQSSLSSLQSNQQLNFQSPNWNDFKNLQFAASGNNPYLQPLVGFGGGSRFRSESESFGSNLSHASSHQIYGNRERRVPDINNHHEWKQPQPDNLLRSVFQRDRLIPEAEPPQEIPQDIRECLTEDMSNIAEKLLSYVSHMESEDYIYSQLALHRNSPKNDLRGAAQNLHNDLVKHVLKLSPKSLIC